MTDAATSMVDDAVEENERFDAIVVGSGMGGLACASLLAQLRDMRVLVLERHWRLGGFTHAFTRPGAGRWDVGLHYVGQMGAGETIRALMDFVTCGRVAWREMPSPFERYHFPGLSAEQPAGADAYLEYLTQRWPREADAIARFFAAVESAYQWFSAMLSSSRTSIRSPSDRLLRGTTRDALNAAGIQSLELKAVLAAQWGNYGLPPRHSAFVSHAVVARHFLAGGWFPDGGASGIAAGARAAIEDVGGKCLTSREVESVLVERSRAIGVRVAHGTGVRRKIRDYLAPIIVSDVGARTTFDKLLAPDVAGVTAARDELRRLPNGSSAVQLFIGLRRSPAELGVRGENHWMFADWDHDAVFDRRNALADGHAAMAYLSFPSLKESVSSSHTAEIIAPLDHAVLAQWADLPWKRRGRDYENMKESIARTLLAFAERHVLGLTALTTYTELATPLTVEQFTGHAGGAIYGLPSVPERFALSCVRVETPIAGLLLTGSDVAVPGVVGALLGGVATAGRVLGPGGMDRVMAAVRGRAIRPIVRVTQPVP